MGLLIQGVSDQCDVRSLMTSMVERRGVTVARTGEAVPAPLIRKRRTIQEQGVLLERDSLTGLAVM